MKRRGTIIRRPWAEPKPVWGEEVIERPCPNCKRVTEFTIEVHHKFGRWLACKSCGDVFRAEQLEVSVRV